MIRLDRVELLHWDIQPHQMLPLSRGVNLLTGENGAGKTSILDALRVALGVARLDGDRSVEKYLLKQARPVAMLRVLIDNRPDEQRRRPFDVLGEYGKDTITLAVVFRAEGESVYKRDYFILDGDQSPLAVPGSLRAPRPLPSAVDYRARLHKVGLTERYLKLLRLPQGQIASLCQYDGQKLFEYLFDVIGGQEVKTNWEERLREMKESQRALEVAGQEIEGAGRQLNLLRQRVSRYEAYLAARQRIAALQQAIPHAQARELRARCERLEQRIHACDRDRQHLLERSEGIQRRILENRQGQRAIEAARQALTERRAAASAQRDACRDELAVLGERFRQGEALREAAQGITPREPAEIERGIEALRISLTAGQTAARARTEERARVAAALAQVERGMLPLPADVEAFRGALRKAGIPHHLLAEVIELEEDSFRDALEGYLGRLRFAVLVQEPASWAEAARLARAARYPYGVLAPDVRGHSEADGEGLLPSLRVREARYHSLVARLLRHIHPGEPPDPLVPPRQGEHLARDGFVVSRIEARVAAAESLYLGRDALQRRRESLLAEHARLSADDAGWQREEQRLRQGLSGAQAALADQRRRLAWEAVAEDHAQVSARRAVLTVEHERLDGVLREVDAGLDACRRDAENGRHSLGELEKEHEGVDAQRWQREDEQRVAIGELEISQAELGRVTSQQPMELNPQAQAFVDQNEGYKVLEAQLREAQRQLDDFSAEERDDLLPQNCERQQREVEVVARRLAQLEAELARTRAAAEEAQEQYQQVTRRIFRLYFSRLKTAGQALDFHIDAKLLPVEGQRYTCDIRVGVGEKAPVNYRSEDLSGGQKAALSILMGMSAVSLDEDSAGFFLIDEPFSASDVNKINELGNFLRRSGAQYLVSMPTSADVEQCGAWLGAAWICTKTRGGYDAAGRPLLAPPVKVAFAEGSRDG